ncbi:MAG: SDR family oxidoreductase [Thermomicrobiaceae bacterium]|nr:SDR family oxidoreductase [Thermomicrobiaceae bacterium]
MADLRGKVALVTGAGSGVGRATSLRLAAEGVAVGLVGRRVEPLEETARQVAAAGGQSRVLPADVGDEEAVAALVRDLVQAFGRLDIVVYSAGVGLYGPVETYALADWQETFATNVTGLFLCARAALPHLRRRGGGHIVAISSGAGLRGYADLAAYSASKFAVLGFMQSLAEEVGPLGIKCTTVVPGSILTEFGPRSIAEKQASGRKYLQPDDVAETILHILGQPARAWTQEVHLWPF